MNRETLKDYTIDAIRDLGGEATHIDIARHVWRCHKNELRSSGDFFYRWQYDLRWAVTNLMRDGLIEKRGRRNRSSLFGLVV